MRSRPAIVWSMLAIASSVLAVALGVWHQRIAFQAIFVFREGEPWTSWLTVLCGPVATLPAALLSFYQREAAGYLLILGAIVSLGTFVLGARGDDELGEQLLAFLARISAPTLATAVAFVFLQRRIERGGG